MALVGLVSEDFYNGVVIDAKGVGPDGIICVRENNPTDDEFFALPEYISRRGVYTEEDCRHLFKQLAEAVKCMHHAGMAHRNLHMENVLATIFVCKECMFDFIFSGVSNDSITPPRLLIVLILLLRLSLTGQSQYPRIAVCPANPGRKAFDGSFWLLLRPVCLQSSRG